MTTSANSTHGKHKKHRCYIGLGSNLQSPLEQVQRAIQSLNETNGVDVVACAPLYASKAIGPGEQPDYINTVIAIDSTLDPEPLLRTLQHIEQQQGRQRNVRWGARTLDLDLLLYANQQIQSEFLTVPHPRMRERNFVIFPLYDLAPALVFPNGDGIKFVRAQLTDEGLKQRYNGDPQLTEKSTISDPQAVTDR